MRILIYISKKDKKNEVNDKFSSLLAHYLTQTAQIDMCGKLPKNITDYSLIHIIGTWSIITIRLQRKAIKYKIPILFSPLGSLEPWRTKKKHLTTLILRYKTIKKISAIHLTSHIELQLFNNLKLNNRTQIIKNSVVTHALTNEDMAVRMTGLYYKILDSNCNSMIGENVQDAINYMMIAGVDPAEINETKFYNNIKPCLITLTKEDWRHIYIYARNENIVDIIVAGLRNMNMNLPDFVIEDIDLFPLNVKTQTGHIEYDKLLSGKTTKRNTDEEPEHNITEILNMLLNIKHEVKKRTIPILHLLDLYTKIKFTEYNEDKLSNALKQVHISRFAGRIMFIMQDIIGLTEGFTPIKIIDDRKTDKLRKIITKLN